MTIMSHILPGNDEVEGIINRYYKTQCIKIKDVEHAPVEVLHPDNVIYITDTATKFNICSFDWLETRRLEGAATRMWPTTLGVSLEYCDQQAKRLGYCAEGYTISIVTEKCVPVRWHACAHFTMGPTLGRDTLKAFGTDISMSKSCFTYNINSFSSEHTFLDK